MDLDFGRERPKQPPEWVSGTGGAGGAGGAEGLAGDGMQNKQTDRQPTRQRHAKSTTRTNCCRWRLPQLPHLAGRGKPGKTGPGVNGFGPCPMVHGQEDQEAGDGQLRHNSVYWLVKRIFQYSRVSGS